MTRRMNFVANGVANGLTDSEHPSKIRSWGFILSSEIRMRQHFLISLCLSCSLAATNSASAQVCRDDVPDNIASLITNFFLTSKCAEKNNGN